MAKLIGDVDRTAPRSNPGRVFFWRDGILAVGDGWKPSLRLIGGQRAPLRFFPRTGRVGGGSFQGLECEGGAEGKVHEREKMG